jgi:hypothetical protein
VKKLGYARVAINGVWIALLFVGIAAATTALDRRLGSGRRIDGSPDHLPAPS